MNTLLPSAIRFSFCTALLLLLGDCSLLVASEVFRDDFNSGDTALESSAALLGGTWTQTGTQPANPIQMSGGAATLVPFGQDLYAAFTAPVANLGSTAIQTSLELNVGAAQADGEYFVHLSNPVGTTTLYYERLFARASANGYQLGLLDAGGSGSATTWGSQELTLGTTYHVDVTWTFVNGARNDLFSVAVDNQSYLTHSWTSASAEPAQVSAVNLRQGTAGASAWLSLDNLVVTAGEAPPAPYNIFEWDYIDAANHDLGKRETTKLTADGYGLHATAGLAAPGKNLSKAYLIGANLNNSVLSSTNLTRAALDEANLTAANLSDANMTGATISGASFTDAVIKNAKLSSTHIALDQLYSTASYKNHDLKGVFLIGNDLSGANLAGQTLAATDFYAAKLVGADFTNAHMTMAELINADLTDANLSGANFTDGSLALANLSHANLRNANLSGTNLIGTNLAGADIRGATLSKIITVINPGMAAICKYCCGSSYSPATQTYTTGTGVTLAQLASTANYEAGDLSNITFLNNAFDRGNFAGFNLTNSDFTGTTLYGADLSGADARGAIGNTTFGTYGSPNFIQTNGHLDGVDLAAGQVLLIRDYDGNASGKTSITVDQHLNVGPGATLRMMLEADAWDSTISVPVGVPITLDGNLELSFAADVNLASQIGRTFDLFDWTGVSRTGAFSLASPYAWDLSKLYTTGEVTFLAASGIAGDFNKDGVVDAADYTAFRNGLGTIYTPAAYGVWKSNFGAASSNSALLPSAVPEPGAPILLTIGFVALIALRIRRVATLRPRAARLMAITVLVVISIAPARAGTITPGLTKIGDPTWKPVDIQMFTAPATPFDAEFGQVYNTLLPYDTPTASSYTPHAPPYDTELSAGMIAGGYVNQSVFTADQITLHPNGVYFAFMLVPDHGVTGSSRDFASGPVFANSVFPIASNIDAWLDGVLVDRLLGADAIIPVQPRDTAFQGTSHLEILQAIWHPWDDDLTVGPVGHYDLRHSIRDAGGNGWDIVAPFQVVVPEPATSALVLLAAVGNICFRSRFRLRSRR